MICKRCFRLIDQIDEIEVTLVDKREDLSNLYYKTKAQNSKEPLENAKDTDAHTGDTLSCGKGQTVVGQVMLDMRSGKLVMHRDLTKENNPSKKVDNRTFPMLSQENFGQTASVSGSGRTGSRRHHQHNRNRRNSTSDSSNTTLRGNVHCNLCNFTAKCQSSLKYHMATHTGEKPYSCSYCTYSAIQKGDLDRHILRHTGERPYVCSYCPYSATRKHHLTAHMNNHPSTIHEHIAYNKK
ncbi:unnamed protein product, partial [Meganyctiphanes norvegica]